jgi:hypothetical protein
MFVAGGCVFEGTPIALSQTVAAAWWNRREPVPQIAYKNLLVVWLDKLRIANSLTVDLPTMDDELLLATERSMLELVALRENTERQAYTINDLKLKLSQIESIRKSLLEDKKQYSQDLDTMTKDRDEWKHEVGIYSHAWARELRAGGYQLVNKTHEIDSLVITTQRLVSDFNMYRNTADKANRIEDVSRARNETGALREGATKAMGMEWVNGVCPDDSKIIAECQRIAIREQSLADEAAKIAKRRGYEPFIVDFAVMSHLDRDLTDKERQLNLAQSVIESINHSDGEWQKRFYQMMDLAETLERQIVQAEKIATGEIKPEDFVRINAAYLEMRERALRAEAVCTVTENLLALFDSDIANYKWNFGDQSLDLIKGRLATWKAGKIEKSNPLDDAGKMAVNDYVKYQELLTRYNEMEERAKKAEANLKGTYTRCTFCDYEIYYKWDDEADHERARKAINEHAKVCQADPKQHALIEAVHKMNVAQAENAEMRAALQFALDPMYEEYMGQHYDQHMDTSVGARYVTVGMIRNARKALATGAGKNLLKRLQMAEKVCKLTSKMIKAYHDSRSKEIDGVRLDGISSRLQDWENMQ